MKIITPIDREIGTGFEILNKIKMFYLNRISIPKFEKMYDEAAKEHNWENEKHLTFRDKYIKYLEINPKLEVWGRACVFRANAKPGHVDLLSTLLISTRGNVWSLKNNKLLKTRIDKHGYKTIQSFSNSYFVHRLVLSTFGKDIETSTTKNKLTVNHIQYIKIDNRLEKLEWATFEENIKHGNIPKSIGYKITVINGYSGLPIGATWFLRERVILKKYGIDGVEVKARIRKNGGIYGMKWTKLLTKIIPEDASTPPPEFFDFMQSKLSIYRNKIQKGK